MLNPHTLSLIRSVATPFAVAYLALGAVVRCVIWAVFGADSRISFKGLLLALLVGGANDLIALLYLAAPLLLIFSLIPKRRLAKRRGAVVLGGLSLAGVFGALFIAVAEVLFWEEFESRFNLIAVDYLIYPTEVLGNIRESYPLPLLLSALTLVALLVWLPLWRRSRRVLTDVETHHPSRRSRFAVAATSCIALVPLTLFYSSDTLRPSGNRAVNELSMNGSATFFRALLSHEIDFHQFYPSLPSSTAFETVRSYYRSLGETLSATDHPTSLVRHHTAGPRQIGKRNVVVLVQESLGAQFVGAYGDTRGLTPNLDALSKESLMFAHAFATGTRTVRGLEAIAASFPPIPSESIVKRRGSDNISNIGSILRQNGYTTSFLYGGYGMFDNMNTFFGSNGFSLLDRLDIKDPVFSNIWGVSDEDLFRAAIQHFDERSKANSGPFFSIVLSTSNHKPFTFRQGVPGVPPKGGGREAGVRYADFAIGEFLKAAREKEWFANTLFVIIADHDSRVYGRAHVPVEHYRIPVLFYAPGFIAPERNEKVFSALDFAPTLLGMLGIEYDAPFYGVDVLNAHIPASRPVMFSHNHNIAWYEGEKLTVIGLEKEVRSFHYRGGKTTPVETDHTAANLLTAQLQSAYELFMAHGY